MKLKFPSSLFSGRRKLGFFSLLSLLAVIILSGVIITGFDTLEQKYALRIDNSFNAITSKSIETDQVLSSLQDDVHVYALFTPGQEDTALLGLLERYAASSKHFTFSIENLLENPALVHQISTSLDDAGVSTDCLIIYGKVKDRTRVLNVTDYIVQAYDMPSGQFYVDGLRYEQSLTEAIVYVTSDDLASIQVLSGHGELSLKDISEMSSLLAQYNYDVREVKQLRDDSLNPADLLMILSPAKDLTNKQIEEIDDFCHAGGSLFIALDFSVYEPMPNFEALLRSFGFRQNIGLVVAMNEETESYYDSPAVLIPYLELAEPTAAMIENKQTTIILAGSTAFYEPEINQKNIQQYVILRSGNAYLRDTSDQADNIEQKPSDEIGTFPLALASERLYQDGIRSKAFIIGNVTVFTDSWLYQNTYSGEFLLNMVQYLSPKKTVNLAIVPKEAIRQPLRISSYPLNHFLLIMLPLSVFLAAFIVLLPRRKR
ncbi:MAG: hypothetical protein GX858_02410 [Clostridiales bacterium]|nr:hypothetical protein [Clostridiales bacterium]